MVKSAFKRILLKVSGEVLAGDQSFGMEPKFLHQVANQIAEVAHQSAASCGAGQGALLRDDFKVPTLPEMAANMNGEV